MPKTFLKMLPALVALASFGCGIISGALAAGAKIGGIETRVGVLEECAVAAGAIDQDQDVRLRSVEAAAAVIPSMAADIREIRAQMTEVLNILARQERG